MPESLLTISLGSLSSVMSWVTRAHVTPSCLARAAPVNAFSISSIFCHLRALQIGCSPLLWMISVGLSEQISDSHELSALDTSGTVDPTDFPSPDKKATTLSSNEVRISARPGQLDRARERAGLLRHLRSPWAPSVRPATWWSAARGGRVCYFVYILENPSGGFYIGHTNDLKKRLRRYNDPTSRASTEGPSHTHKYGPWMMVWKERHTTRSAAMRRQKQIKAKKSSNWIRKLPMNT